MDPISLAGAYQGLKAAKDILTTLFDAKVDSEAKPRILEAQSRLGEVQDALFMLREKLAELQEERDELRRSLASAQMWKESAGKYELCTTPGGAVVYRYKEQPEHFACPSCFNKQQSQILQDNRVVLGTYCCPGCNANFPVKNKQSMGPVSIRRG
jgi:hypothetical protein